MASFYRRRDGGYIAGEYTRGPWDARFQHGGPPSALLLREASRAVHAAAGPGFSPLRFGVEFHRPVPLGALTIETDPPEVSRRLARTRLRLRQPGGKLSLSAEATHARLDPAAVAETLRPPGYAAESWPDPGAIERFRFPFFTDATAYHQAIDLRLVDGPWGASPIRVWARPTLALVDDEEATPEEAVVILADAESGIGPPLDPARYAFVNPDLTVYFGRRPRAGWVGLAVTSYAEGEGVGLSEAALRDDAGVFGRSAQSLVVSRR